MNCSVLAIIHCSDEELKDTLFACQLHNRVEIVGYCPRGCIEEEGGPEGDLWESLHHFKQNENEATHAYYSNQEVDRAGT